MSRGQWIEIMEPQSLADEIVEWHKNVLKDKGGDIFIIDAEIKLR